MKDKLYKTIFDIAGPCPDGNGVRVDTDKLIKAMVAEYGEQCLNANKAIAKSMADQLDDEIIKELALRIGLTK